MYTIQYWVSMDSKPYRSKPYTPEMGVSGVNTNRMGGLHSSYYPLRYPMPYGPAFNPIKI
jgi:hypothetical protein